MAFSILASPCRNGRQLGSDKFLQSLGNQGRDLFATRFRQFACLTVKRIRDLHRRFHKYMLSGAARCDKIGSTETAPWKTAIFATEVGRGTGATITASNKPPFRDSDVTGDKTVPLAWLVAKFTGSHRSFVHLNPRA